jgi:hypothetical protein
LNHARAIGADPNVVLARYGLERFLHRLARSAHADRFVQSGGRQDWQACHWDCSGRRGLHLQFELSNERGLLHGRRERFVLQA